MRVQEDSGDMGRCCYCGVARPSFVTWYMPDGAILERWCCKKCWEVKCHLFLNKRVEEAKKEEGDLP